MDASRFDGVPHGAADSTPARAIPSRHRDDARARRHRHSGQRSDHPLHAHRGGDRPERRGRHWSPGHGHERRDQHCDDDENEQRRPLCLYRPHARRIRPRRRTEGVQALRAIRHRAADCAGDPARRAAGSRPDYRRGLRRRRNAARPQHLERARPGDRLQADPVAAAQRPPVPAARDAHSRSRGARFRGLRGKSCRRRCTEFRAPQRQRHAVVRKQLSARRRRQQRAVERLHQRHAAARGDPGIQGPDEQPVCGVRGVRRRRRQPHDPIRNQPPERLGVRVPTGTTR